MESYDPRTPIIKATDDELAEVEGHGFLDAETADQPGWLNTDDQGDDSEEVEVHGLLDAKRPADEPNERTF